VSGTGDPTGHKTIRQHRSTLQSMLSNSSMASWFTLGISNLILATSLHGGKRTCASFLSWRRLPIRCSPYLLPALRVSDHSVPPAARCLNDALLSHQTLSTTFFLCTLTISRPRPNYWAGGKMRICRCVDVVTGNLRIQNCGYKTADTTLFASFA